MHELRKKADKLWREACLEKWGRFCAICGKPASDIHHFIRKGECQYLRFNVDNGVPICRKHHRMIDHRSREEREKIKKEIVETRGKLWYNELRRKEKEAPTSFVNKEWIEDNIQKLKRFLYEW